METRSLHLILFFILNRAVKAGALSLIMVLFFCSGCQQADSTKITLAYEPVEIANPLMGTDSRFDLSNGNTYPAIAVPWGMNFWTPMTSEMGDGWTYKYDDNKLRGIKQTHQPSPWLNDYGAFSLMAVEGALRFHEEERASWFSHKAEEAHPYHYKVYLADYDITAEVSPTERAAHFQFTFPESDSSYLILDAFEKGSMVRIIPEERKIIGYNRYNHGGVPDNFHNYFVAQFDKDFEVYHTWNDEWQLSIDSDESTGDHVGAIIGFHTKEGEKIGVRVASSFISHQQAQLNLDREIGIDDFNETKSKAYQAWQKEFDRIVIKDDNIDNIRTFYSCLYRLLLFPRKFYELDENENVVHYSPYNGQVLPGFMFTDNGFWDTFRAVFPFFTLMYPSLNAQIMQGLVNTYKESGWLPEWASPGHRNVMIGSNSAVNIADSYLKGIRGYDIDLLYEAMVKNASTSEGRPLSKNGKPINSVGREGVEYYNRLGYVPYDVGINENAARTLEYAYADFNIAQLAKLLDKPQSEIDLYSRRSQNYKHLFDDETHWMRGRNEDGAFQSPFNPLKWGDAFTEGNSIHYTWSVFHDIEGLMSLMGGEDNFVQKLDEVFSSPPDFDASYYGFIIHEIREMQIVDMGNYAHGNQPIQHMLYLYNHAKQPWKTQQKVREVMGKLYSATPDGYCGDEDNGQTSAWYVFSALGFYPVTPGTTQYVIGSPLFDNVVLSMEDGKEFEISALNNDSQSIYISDVKLNNDNHHRTWLDHFQIQQGGILEFDMSEEPNKNWGTKVDSTPYSSSTQ